MVGRSSVKLTFKLAAIGRPVGPLSTGAGVVEISESGMILRFAYQTEDLAGAFRSGSTQEVRLGGPLRFAQLKLKSGCLSNRLIVDVARQSATNKIPGIEQGRMILKIPLCEREAARQAEVTASREPRPRRTKTKMMSPACYIPARALRQQP